MREMLAEASVIKKSTYSFKNASDVSGNCIFSVFDFKDVSDFHHSPQRSSWLQWRGKLPATYE